MLAVAKGMLLQQWKQNKKSNIQGMNVSDGEKNHILHMDQNSEKV